MYPVIGGLLIGAYLVGRTKPTTKLRRLSMFGPRTGATYTVEIMPGENAIVVHDGKGSIALFAKTGNGYSMLKALQGTKESLLAMNSDFT